MATNFPGSLDAFTNPTSGDTLDNPPHDQQHADVNDAVEALQAKVGVDGSADTGSLDYQINTGYRYHSTVYFTSSGTFTKATYPWLRAVRVRLVGGGGGGGGVEGSITGTSTSVCKGGNGGGAGYAEAIVAASSLSASETVTVGAGGSGGGSGVNAGSDGGASSFGSHCAADGGGGGAGGARATHPISVANGAAGAATAGDLQLDGNRGPQSLIVASDVGISYSGWSRLGAGIQTSVFRSVGANGESYGGGAGGAVSTSQNVARDGGTGGPGIVLVELYA